MTDPNLEKKIKQTKEFVELWLKFRQLYRSAIGKSKILPEEEKIFLETKTLIARRYQSLIEALGVKPSVDDRTFDVIKDVLSLERVTTMSDDQMQRIENDWHNSLIIFNQILGGLENKKEELANISSFTKIGKNLSEISWGKVFVVLVAVILFAAIIKLNLIEKIIEQLGNLYMFNR